MSANFVTTCPFCHKPHTVNLSKFENDTPLIADLPAAPYDRRESVFADSIRYATWLALGSAATWAILVLTEIRNPPYWVAPAGGLAVTLGIEAAKIWVSRPPRPEPPKPEKTRLEIQISESLPAGKRYLLADIDEAISLDDLAIVATAENFSRAAVTRAGLSQGKFHKVKNEFLRLNLCYPLPNNQNGYGLTLRGKALLRRVGQHEA